MIKFSCELNGVRDKSLFNFIAYILSEQITCLSVKQFFINCLDKDDFMCES